jgi:hypothetical protein
LAIDRDNPGERPNHVQQKRALLNFVPRPDGGTIQLTVFSAAQSFDENHKGAFETIAKRASVSSVNTILSVSQCPRQI